MCAGADTLQRQQSLCHLTVLFGVVTHLSGAMLTQTAVGPPQRSCR